MEWKLTFESGTQRNRQGWSHLEAMSLAGRPMREMGRAGQGGGFAPNTGHSHPPRVP